SAHAAWHGRTQVLKDDIRAAALLALPHRRRRNPFDAPGLDEDLLDQLLEDDEPPEPPDAPPDAPQDGPDGESDGDDGSPAAPEVPDDQGTGANEHASQQPPATSSESEAPGHDRDDVPAEAELSITGAGAPERVRLFTVRGVGVGEPGRRSRAVTDSGRRTGSTRDGHGPLHLSETIRAAAPHQRSRGRMSGPLAFRGEDLRVATREGHESNLVLFCVDASGSMAARRRMTEVKGAIMSLLLDAYRRRDKVGLVTFRGADADLALPPTRSIDIAARRLDQLPAGGRTPLDAGLLEAARVIEVERVRDPRRRPLLVVVTDGRATNGRDGVARSRRAAEHLAQRGVSSLVVDCEAGPVRFGLAHALAAALRAEHVPLSEVTSAALTDVVERRVA
ncbi:MAG: VWA domain-containing protein, partial [Marmoricola sp.]|nr:VWA domain-containing protein [Marmoricola sp.]